MVRALTVRPLAVAVALSAAPAALADTSNFDISGKIYTKYMYQNDASQGCLSMSNPFWVDNIGGHNGVCTEFELNIKARVGPKVSAGVRLQSRWGSMWQDWWENGDLKPGTYDTSGESLGMNHAQYIKLRGAYVRMAPPIPTVKWVTIGSTDYSMWNEWTIGKARYIDRDNGSGVFIEGEALPAKRLSYTVGAMALPKLWAGPGWQTGLRDNDPLASVYGTDWAFAAKVESRPIEDLRAKLVGSWLQDWEADKNSPFLTGRPDAARDADHSVALSTRFRGLNATLDATWTPSWLEFLSVSGLAAISSNYVNPLYATNQVRNGQGFSPLVYKKNIHGEAIASTGQAHKVLVEVFDPLKAGLSAKLEYFNIGSEYNAVMGSRREADVLLTEGMVTGGFTRGGQLPTLNIANEFQDWDEPWYESCIGWRGATLLLEYVQGPLKATVEVTGIGYNTNMQGRDVDFQYPDFLYTHGFTDTTAFTADSDYANVYDRGRDPRSVYAEYQDRRTGLAVANVQYAFTGLAGAVVSGKVKVADDLDRRRIANPNDDYHGKMLMLFGTLSLQPTNELKTTVGYEYSRWNEGNREGSETAGYYDSQTRRHTARAGFTYAFGGANLGYTLEYFHKDLQRDPRAYYNMLWNVWRSKATFEVAW
jgi:opacity protein-like surface antigen